MLLGAERSPATEALLTSTSRRPQRSARPTTAARMPSRDAMFRTTPTAWPPAAVISSTTFSTNSGLRSFTPIAAPMAARCRAVARPMPLPAPVTSATRPASRPGSFRLSVAFIASVLPYQGRRHGLAQPRRLALGFEAADAAQVAVHRNIPGEAHAAMRLDRRLGDLRAERGGGEEGGPPRDRRRIRGGGTRERAADA